MRNIRHCYVNCCDGVLKEIIVMFVGGMTLQLGCLKYDNEDSQY